MLNRRLALMPKTAKAPEEPGPKPDVPKVEGDWKDAVRSPREEETFDGLA